MLHPAWAPFAPVFWNLTTTHTAAASSLRDRSRCARQHTGAHDRVPNGTALQSGGTRAASTYDRPPLIATSWGGAPGTASGPRGTTSRRGSSTRKTDPEPRTLSAVM